MNINSINLKKLAVLYSFSVLPVVTLFMFSYINRPEHIPYLFHLLVAMIAAAVASAAVPFFIGLVCYALYTGVIFLCSADKK